MNITRLDVSLEGFDVGLTGAVPGRDDWSEPAMDRAILEFVALLSGVVFKYGGRIVHGSHPSFTPVILRQARMHGCGNKKVRPVTLVMSALWADTLAKEDKDAFADVAEFIVTEKIGSGGVEDPETRDRSLSVMRKTLLEKQNITVAVGGRIHHKDSFIPGVREELELAAKKGNPCFVIGGMGGYAAEVAKGMMPAFLRNKLSDEENLRLFTTRDVTDCVNMVFEGLIKMRRI